MRASRIPALALVAGLAACNKDHMLPGGGLKSQRDKASYAVGLNLGRSFKQQNADLDLALVEKGMKDAVSGSQPMLSDSAVQATLMQLQNDMMTRTMEEGRKKGEKNLKDATEFLAKNAKEAGVVTLPDSLEYKVEKEGHGPIPKPTDTVICEYVGSLLDGTEFDSSKRHGGPATFPVTGVIPGWTEALQRMPVGSKWKLWIPSKLAYGERGAGPTIGPNSLLVFELELQSIKGAPAGDSAHAAAPAAKAK